ncbi:MAG: hypothetical protein AABX01_01535 [Candidatus Micrarchaeota archaeon]
MAQKHFDWKQRTEVLCKLDRCFDRNALEKMVKEHIITPLDRVHGPQIDKLMAQHGPDAGKNFFFVSVRNPTYYFLGGARTAQDVFHNRVSYHKPVFPRRDEDNVVYALKGVGAITKIICP